MIVCMCTNTRIKPPPPCSLQYGAGLSYYKIHYAAQCLLQNPDCLFIATNTDSRGHFSPDMEWPGAGATAGAIQGETSAASAAAAAAACAGQTWQHIALHCWCVVSERSLQRRSRTSCIPTDSSNTLHPMQIDRPACCTCHRTAVVERAPVVTGKPSPFLMQAICKQHSITPERAIIVGDRLDTGALLLLLHARVHML